MGPEPVVALMEAIQQDDEKRVDAIWEDMRSVPPFFPPGAVPQFAQYNAQAEKWRFNAAGFVKCGPSRAPYRDLPDNWKKHAELNGKGWAELRKKYMKSRMNRRTESVGLTQCALLQAKETGCVLT